jgi:endoglucanase
MNTLIVSVLVILIALSNVHSQCYRGVNLSGLEFGSAIPGQFNKDYTVPTQTEVTYYTGKGMNTFRLPFMWERLQGQQNGPFNQTYLGYIDDFTTFATGRGAYVILDPHNYARYFGQVIGQQVPVGSFANLWTNLANHFKSNSRVIFGLMNEPHDMSTELWLSDANAAIAAIRATGATNLITVPGNAWTGAASWTANWYGTSNAQVMTGVKDTGNNFVFEIHQYLDSDSSGTHPECVNSTIGSSRLMDFTAWAKQHGYKAILGEWAGGANQLCYSAITDMLTYIDSNSDVIVGWTWWGGGPWWGNYMYGLDPKNGQDAPQMQYLTPHLCR